MIDWKEVAKQNGLDASEFKQEILMCAATIGSLKLDEDNADEFIFTCSDLASDIEVSIKRTKTT